MIKIGLMDVDLLDGGTRHPNLAQMKMASYCIKYNQINKCIKDIHLIYKQNELDNLESFDIILVSKVFKFTNIPKQLHQLIRDRCSDLHDLNSPLIPVLEKYKNSKPEKTEILIGGTGFFEDGGNDLEYDVEHSKPYYNLYDDFIKYKVQICGREKSYYNDYLNSSIGFTTRGCFRKCSFCVNKKYNKCMIHSPLEEFIDKNRPIIYLWDDNFFALKNGWEEILDDLNSSGKKYQFRQGLDIRLLDEKRAEKLSKAKYYGDFIFAFDHIQDKDIIENKLKIWKKYCKKETKLYILCAYDARNEGSKYSIKGNYSVEKKDLIDIENTFERISILMKYGCLPYIMRYESYKESPYKGIYTSLARWCNQPGIFKKMSFEEFCIRNQDYAKTTKHCAALRSLELLKKDAPRIYNKYAKLKFSEECEYK